MEKDVKRYASWEATDGLFGIAIDSEGTGSTTAKITVHLNQVRIRFGKKVFIFFGS